MIPTIFRLHPDAITFVSADTTNAVGSLIPARNDQKVLVFERVTVTAMRFPGIARSYAFSAQYVFFCRDNL